MKRSISVLGLALALCFLSMATQAGTICVIACGGGGTLGGGTGLDNPGGGTVVAPPLFVPHINSIDYATLSFAGTSLVVLDQTRLPDLLSDLKTIKITMNYAVFK